MIAENRHSDIIKRFCFNHGFKEVKIIKEGRFVKNVSGKEWFAVDILDDRVKISYENYNLNVPIIKDYTFTLEYIDFIADLKRVDEFIKKEFLRFVESTYCYILNH